MKSDALELRHNKDYRLLVIGQSTSVMGSAMIDLSIIWLLFELSGSTLYSGIGMAISFAPSVILGPYIGSLVVLLSRKRTVIWTDVIRGVVNIGLAAVVLTSQVPVSLVLGLVLVSAIASSFFQPAIGALVPAVVETQHLAKANSVFSIVTSVSGIAGPVIGGVLYATIGPEIVFAVNGATFLFSAAIESRIEVDEHTMPIREGIRSLSPLKDVRATLGYLRRNKRVLVVLLLFAAVNFFGGFYVGFPAVISRLSNGGTIELGAFNTVFYLGSFLVGLAFMRGWIGYRFLWILVGLAVQGVGMIAIGWTSSLIVIGVSMSLYGIGIELVNICATSHFQMNVPEEILPHFWAFSFALAGVFVPAGSLFYGAFGSSDWFSLLVVLSGIACMLLVGIGALLVRNSRANGV
jgi:MFS transporter, DHA3 family, macrolide efflux protein